MKKTWKRPVAVALSVAMVYTSAIPAMTVNVSADAFEEFTSTSEYEESFEITDSVEETEEDVFTESEGEEAVLEDQEIQETETVPEEEFQEETVESESLQSESVSEGETPEQTTMAVEEKDAVTEELTLNLNGTEYKGAGLENVMSQNGLSPADITSLTYVSGVIPEGEFGTGSYLYKNRKSFNKLTSISVNLSESLKYTEAGTTVLPGWSFYGLPALTSIELGGFTELGEYSVAADSAYSTKLTTVNAPDVKILGHHAFSKCSKITAFDLSNVTSIGEEAFVSSGITSADLSSVTFLGKSAFSKTAKLENLVIGSGLTEIPDKAFEDTEALHEVTIPETVSRIGERAFYGSRRVDLTVTMESATAPELGKNVFQSKGTVQAVVPEGSLPNYLPDIQIGTRYQGTAPTWDSLKVVDSAYTYLPCSYQTEDWKGQPILQAWGEICAKVGEPIGDVVSDAEINKWAFAGFYSDKDCTEGNEVTSQWIVPEEGALYVKTEKVRITVHDYNGQGEDKVITLPTDNWNALKSLFPEYPMKDGVSATQWNTSPDGTGVTVVEDTKFFKHTDIYPIYEKIEKIQVKFDDGEAIGAPSFGSAMMNAPENVKKIEITEGEVTQADLKTLSNVQDTLESFIIDPGVEVEGKMLPSGCTTSASNLKYLELNGIETMSPAAFACSNLETLIIPDAKAVPYSAINLGYTPTLKVLRAPKAEVFEMSVKNQTNLEEIDLSSVKTLGRKDNDTSYSGIFEGTGIKEINLPALEWVGYNAFKGCKDLVIRSNQMPQFKERAFDSRTTIELQDEEYVKEFVKTLNGDDKTLDNYNGVKVTAKNHVKVTFSDKVAKTESETLLKIGNTYGQLPEGTEVEGQVFAGWNTKEDGSGEMVTADSTVPGTDVVLYAVYQKEESNVTVKINGNATSGEDLAEAITKAGLSNDQVTSLEFVSGKVTQTDLDYLANLLYLEEFTMNVGENLTLVGKDGQPTTVLSADTAVLKFAGKPDGHSRESLKTLTVGGVTEVQKEGMSVSSAVTVSFPDVVTVGPAAFAYASWMETLNLPKAQTVGRAAFMGSTRLENLNMESVVSLGEDSFKYTDALDTLVLPETIKTIENIRFGICKSGTKRANITIKAAEPPTVANGAFQGVSSTGGKSTLHVAEGTLQKYVAGNDISKPLGNKSIIWNNLYLEAPDYNRVEFYSKNSWEVQYSYVKAGETIPETLIAEAKPSSAEADMKFVEWNTKQDGKGETFAAGSQVTPNMKVYPIFREKQEIVTVNVNGTNYVDESLAEAVKSSKLAESKVTDVEFVSGKVTAADLAYAGKLSNLKTFKLNLSDTLTYVDEAQKTSTVLPDSAFRGARELRVVELGGFTEIGDRAFQDAGLESIKIQDAVTIRSQAFLNNTRLTSIELPKVKTIENLAFQGSTKMETVNMPVVETIGKNAFYWTDAYREILIPETIKELNGCGFGFAKYGTPEIHVTIQNADPSSIVTSGYVFSSKNSESTVTVPENSIEKFLKGGDINGVLSPVNITWQGLKIADPAYKRIEYHGGNSWDKAYAYVRNGASATEKQMPVFKKNDYIQTGWNTKADGTGTALTTETPINEDMVVYALWEKVVEAPKTEASNIGTGIEVTWTEVEGVGGYDIYRKAAGEEQWTKLTQESLGADVRTYVDETAVFEQEYAYCAVAFKEIDGEIVYSAYTEDTKATRTLAKTEVTAEATTEGIQMSWKEVPGADGYYLYRAEPGGKWQRLQKNPVGADVTSYVDTTGDFGKEYHYTVKAYAVMNGQEYYGTYPTDVTAIRKMEEPKVVANNVGVGISVSWKEVPGADGYYIYRKDTTEGARWQGLKAADANARTYLDKTAVFGKEYYYTVKAYAKQDDGEVYSTYPVNIKCSRYLTEPVVKTEDNGAFVKITWSESLGAQGYHVYRKEMKEGAKWQRINPRALNSSTRSFSDYTGENNVEYYYTVKAGAAQNGKFVYSTFPLDVTGKKVFEEPKVTTKDLGSSVQMSWNKVPGAEGYYVYRRSVGGRWERLQTKPVGADVTSYVDKTGKDNVEYYYTVKAYYTYGGKEYYSTFPVDVTGKKVFQATEVSAENLGGDGIKMSWNKVPGAEGYYVYRAEPGKGWERLQTKPVGADVTSYVDTTALYGVKYHYTAKAYYIQGGTYVYNEYPTDVTCVRELQTPQVEVSGSGDGVNIQWTETKGADGYYVYRKGMEEGATWQRISEETAVSRSYKDTKGQPGVSYYYTVKAYAVQDGKVAYSQYVTDVVGQRNLSTPVVYTESVWLKQNETLHPAVEINWEDMDEVTGFIILRKGTQADNDWEEIGRATAQDRRAFDLKGNSGEIYYYSVQAYKEIEGKTLYSNYVTDITGTFPVNEGN